MAEVEKVSALLHVVKIKTAMDLRKLQARTVLTQAELEKVFEELSQSEITKFFELLDRKGVDTPEAYIKWLKEIKVL